MDIGSPLSQLQPFAAVAERLADRNRRLEALGIDLGDRASNRLELVVEALSRLTSLSSSVEVLDAVPRELWATRIFDRLLMSEVQGAHWIPRVGITEAGSTGRPLVHTMPAGWAIALTVPLVEEHVVRRRCAALVSDAPAEPRTFAPFVKRVQTQDYVVAPVVMNGTVTGLLHADTASSGRPLSESDRALLKFYAGGVGQVINRADLRDRMRLQREALDTLRRQSLDLGPSHDAVWQPRSAVTVGIAAEPEDTVLEPARFGALSKRERQVLALLARGLTNAQMASQLTLAETTVKTHVKHILRKLDVPNRSAAIGAYLAGSPPDGELR